MSTLAERLRLARQRAGFEGPKEAAESMGISRFTYTQHENATRGVPRDKAVKYAKKFKVSLDWLLDGRGHIEGTGKNQLVGKVGAGGEVYRFEDGTHLGDGNLPDHLPPGNVAIIEGDSQYPLLWDGWLVVYGPEYQGVPERCVGRLCVVGVKDGPTLLKILKRGKRKGLWDLESINAPTRHDQKVEWAALVEDIRPR